MLRSVPVPLPELVHAICPRMIDDRNLSPPEAAEATALPRPAKHPPRTAGLRGQGWVMPGAAFHPRRLRHHFSDLVCDLSAVGRIQFLHDVANVNLDGTLAELQLVSDDLVC